MSTESKHTQDMTIEEYLYGCVGYPVGEDAVQTILVDREVESGSSISALDKRIKDLCKADLLMWLVTSPSVTGTTEDSNGVWKHREGGMEMSVSDKKHLTRQANRIYRMYGEGSVSTGMKLNSFGVKLYR